jgi:hypothetical protein
MANHLIVKLPSAYPHLRREFEEGVEEYADVRPVDSYPIPFESIKLVMEIFAYGTTIALNVAAIVDFIRKWRDEKEKQGVDMKGSTIGVPDGGEVPLDQIDEEVLMSLLQKPPQK